jgi:hypothetical protein
MAEIQLQAVPGQSVHSAVGAGDSLLFNVVGMSAIEVSVFPETGNMLVETSTDGISFTAWPLGSMPFPGTDVFVGTLKQVRITGVGSVTITGKD